MLGRVLAVVSTAVLVATSQGQFLLKGGPTPSESGPCIPSDQLERERKLVMDYQSKQARTNPNVLFGFFPHAGTLWQDLWLNNFCDLNPASPAFVDFDGTDFTYDGHQGHDSCIRGFDEQTIGYPIFAAMDGTVIDCADGNYDRNTQAGNFPANYVIVDHGNGFSTWYWHMKSGSVLVHTGDTVRAGQQIGSTGSSGSSTAPHLHFQCVQNGQFFEPNAGVMRPGASNWENQVPIPRQTYLADFNITGTNPSSWGGPPFEWPRTGSFAAGSFTLWNLVDLRNLPANSTFRLTLRNPAGALVLDSGTQNFNNSIAYRASNWIFYWNLSIPTPGQWTIQMIVNGAQLKSCPFSVVTSPAAIVNRPPNPVTAMIDPIRPNMTMPVFCRVNSDLILDDPDYDVVRYRYQWRVDGTTVRDIVSSGRADCIPVGLLATGHTVSCAVTPSDGQASGTTTNAVVQSEPASISVTSGLYESGSLASLRYGDSQFYAVKSRSGPVSSSNPLQVVVQTSAFSPTNSGMSVTIQGYTSVGFTQRVEAYDNVANDWVLVGQSNASTSNSVLTLALPGPVSRFIGSANNVFIRISYGPAKALAPPFLSLAQLPTYHAYLDRFTLSETP